MARSVEQYKKLLISLLPIGKIWPKEPASLLVKFLKGLGTEFNRLEIRSDTLKSENFVTKTSELITEHETDFSVPDEGFSLADATTERRDELLASLIARGEQDKDYFEEIAEDLGYDIYIEEFTPFWAGNGVAGDPCGDQVNVFFWKVFIEVNGLCDTPLNIDPAEVNIGKIMYKFRKLKPAHTHVLFDFGGLETNRGDATKLLCEFGRGFGRGFDGTPHWDNSWGLLQEKELDFGRDFNNAFTNAYDYDGLHYTGGFHEAFAIAFDRNSGGEISYDEFSTAFHRPK